MNKKRILFVVSSLSVGGAQKVLANISLGLPNDWECDFLLNDSQEITYKYCGNIIDLGLKLQKNKRNLYYQFVLLIKRFVKLRNLKKSGRYVACVSALTSANTVNVLTGNKYCKTVATVHSHMSRALKESSFISRILETTSLKMILRRADRIVSVSKGVGDDLISSFGIPSSKVSTIYNSILTDDILAQAEEPLSEDMRELLTDAENVLVTVGRLEVPKAYHSLIKAMSYVVQKKPRTRLLILGEGSLHEKLQSLIWDKGLQKHIFLCGFQKNPYALWSRSDLFVSSSVYEGLPCVLQESLCLGIPIVSTDFEYGARELLAPSSDFKEHVAENFEFGEFGVLCPLCRSGFDRTDALTAEERILADAIIYMLDHKALCSQYSDKGKEFAKSFFVEIIAQEWIRLFEKE